MPQIRKINGGIQRLRIPIQRVRPAPNALRNEAGQVFTAVRFFKQEVTVRRKSSPRPGLGQLRILSPIQAGDIQPRCTTPVSRMMPCFFTSKKLPARLLRLRSNSTGPTVIAATQVGCWTRPCKSRSWDNSPSSSAKAYWASTSHGLAHGLVV